MFLIRHQSRLYERLQCQKNGNFMCYTKNSNGNKGKGENSNEHKTKSK